MVSHSEIVSMTSDIDQFVTELDSELLRLYKLNSKPKLIKSYQLADMPPFGSQSGEVFELSGLSDITASSDRSSRSRPSTCSTIYSDFGETLLSEEGTRKGECKDVSPQKLCTLLSSEISQFCANLNNVRYLKLEVQSSLHGRVAPEMCPGHSAPSVVLCCRLGNWRWYTAKSMNQLRSFDKFVRGWFELDGKVLARLPDLNPSSSPKVCQATTKALESYIQSLSDNMSSLHDHVVGEIGAFLSADTIAPSPIFETSTYAFMKATVGYKVRFCVFTNGAVEIYDCPGGKQLKRISLYLSSVQMADMTYGITISELDSKSVNVKQQTLLVFAGSELCNKWLEMLQAATHTKATFSHTVATLPYSLVSWS